MVDAVIVVGNVGQDLGLIEELWVFSCGFFQFGGVSLLRVGAIFGKIDLTKGPSAELLD